MWTPRRILLFLLGLFGFGAAYTGYAHFLGSIDGLPTLPAKYLIAEHGVAEFPADTITPTVAKLIEAFGPDCPERNDAAYPIKSHMPEDGIVFAAGRPHWGGEPSKFVTLAPFSVALYAKPRPPHEQLPGEVVEISTLHADKAILEFDRPVGSDKDLLSNKAKLVGLELRSDPTPFTNDKRNGRIHITNNQRSVDPNKALIFKTPGPVFYRVADPDKPNSAAPDIWTSAAVQVENRENMPRPLRGASLPAVPVPGVGPMIGTDVVAEMILGIHTPPPTITADGMKIYLKPSSPSSSDQQPGVKKRSPAFAGVRQIELSENVVMNLWVDGKSGFPGSTAASSNTLSEGTKPVPGDPPLGAAAVIGGLADGGILSGRLAEKSLVQIRTLGPFKYDYATNAARFEIAAQANPHLPNHVEVTRLSAHGTRDYLVCQLLELEFDRPLTQGGIDPPSGRNAIDRETSPALKAVKATGEHVYISAEAERLEAQGTALIYRTGLPDPKEPNRTYTQTVLHGAPLLAVREKNKLEAGRTNLPGQLVLTTVEPLPESEQTKETRATVRGPGQVELFDPVTNDMTMRAVWKDSLEHAKDQLGGRNLDLFVFAGGGRFEDPKGTFELAADTLKLWLDNTEKDNRQPLPFRLQGVGNVHGRSEDAIIRDTDHLNVMFNEVSGVSQSTAVATGSIDVPIAAPSQPSANVSNTPVAVAPPPPLLVEPLQPAPPPAKKNPFYLSAKNVEVWVARRPPEKNDKPQAQQEMAVRYELDRARCDGRVLVHQEPADPDKSPKGLDIAAATLHLNRAAAGHAMTAIGSEQLAAEVHFENVSLSGPHIVIDQPNNLVRVTGKGWLRMPSGSDLGGQNLAKPADLTVVWQDRMRFSGERREAEFLGRVQAEQRTEKLHAPAEPSTTDSTWSRSYALGHRLEVTFDRPIYFNQFKMDREKKQPNEKTEDSPKIETVVCSPAPEDSEAGRVAGATRVVFAEEVFSSRTGKHVKAQRIEARVLELRTQGGTTFATASGPGETRTLQIGDKNLASPPPNVLGAAPTRTAMKPADAEEMKLTVVRFGGRVQVKDQRGIFQKAVYEDAVRVFHVPSENLNERIEEHAAPPRSVVLRCTDTLTVTQYKATDGSESTRQMEAVGAAKVQDDLYIGDGHTVTYDGALIVLRGYADGLATLRQRLRATDQTKYYTGREIIYDTRTGAANARESSGGLISNTR
jgi:hypothetical protein